MNHPARANHRIIPITLDGDNWFMQYSPYVYYNEHCIVFKDEHEPMLISQKTFDRLLDFVLEVASGKETKSEERGFREISIFKDGVVL